MQKFTAPQKTDTLKSNTTTCDIVMFFRLILLTVLLHSLFPATVSAVATEKNNGFNRIISLYPAHTENLAALGASEKLIGISPSDTYPPEILSKQRFSHHDNAEKFIAAQPDLVLIRPMVARAAPQLIEQLEGAGITVISVQPRSIEEMLDYWLYLGRLSGREHAAVEMVAEFNGELEADRKKIQTIAMEDRPLVYFESIHSKMKTFSPTSIAIFVLEQAGGRNIATDAKSRKGSNIAAYGKERILSHAEDIDIFLAQQGRMNRVTREIIEQEPGFQAIRAIREGSVFLVDEQLVSRPTRRILEGIRIVHDILYPAGK